MKASVKKSSLATNLFMLCIGLILSLPAAHRVYVYATFSMGAVFVQGAVDKPAAGADFGGRPLVRYHDLQGQEHIFKSRVKTHFLRAPRNGEEIRVMFLKTDPGTAMVESRLHYIFLPLLFIAVGVAVVVKALKNCWRSVSFSA